MAELPGILNWSLDGFDRLQGRGHLIQPQSGMELANELASLASPINTFIRDWCVTGVMYEVECDKLYKLWCAWCEQRGHKPGATNGLSRQLHAALPTIKTGQPREGESRQRYYYGIGMLADYKPPPSGRQSR